MKILHITPSYFPATKFGGPIFSMKIINQHLSKKNYIEVITTQAGTNNEKNKHLIDKIKVNYLPFYFNENFTFSPKLIIYLIKNIYKYDLIQINSIWNFHFIISALLCRIYKKPYVIYPKGSLDKNAINNRKKIIKNIYLILIRKLIDRANAIIYSSNFEKRNISKIICPKNGLVIANPIEVKRDVGQFKKEKIILYLGRIANNKGIAELINRFTHTKLGYQLIIAGEIEDQKYYQKIRKLFKKDKRIKFLKNQNQKNKNKLICRSFCTILPSIVNENFGNSIAESMVLKTPVIVSSKAGISEYVKKYNCGVIINPEKYSLIQAVEIIENNYTRYQNNGKKLVAEKFEAKIVAQKINKLYAKIIK
ncbi:hypothetical protein COZ61_00355 [Candidatus Berkelbacteria bacterium CG_4_8_14_3_um_filter_33_6]|uniref:Glycosyl transferase family 1 domain-containing protein n=1 Tax=Candidatus Berkelbacteria bacterium CG_4_10_14_0_2_um_filter_35_9_33_12 TaxID=1974499 RepID=A0A2M7W402_9BACT|nr:MAG: hypothetical protein COX10_02260 [Candidatus Berkelbacteria bacterium CG23_combo_of_CG06-09_8_20_14_all_33_15]PIS08553.1 MAG: hypothetical protein COT76_00780 [Candidatus Berkelbacteria bacterium CG10_big_fil_rev_8_21_14_0_10_33_10]PIX31322.1 MAG: hypothetical protein COZ61_00355 [Candidatus Berkelbacteria bacterium CG_4_8_14_3_um_filter_33_6]PIZ27957.1 MAG: hypothetical protein COY43_03160 [Candidatus Berkelbacteria bacterium CG_4_10_14_0_8_um_filter_35_9_33_8]PJA20319.1 MAG: hypotheti